MRYNESMLDICEEILKKATAKYRFIFERGYLPSRQTIEYTPETIYKTNCAGHAVANLTNGMLESFLHEENVFIFSKLFCEQGLIKAAKTLGLIARPCDKYSIAGPLSWKVGYYDCPTDGHFIHEVSPKLYTHKKGWHKNIEILTDMPDEIETNKKYKFYSAYMITNPKGKDLSEKQLNQLEIDVSKL